MKFIIKGVEPDEFTKWKKLANPEWQPTYNGLQGEEKKAVKQALLKEQGEICCYCERRLTDNDSHIEHFRPQNDPMVDPLDFNNLLCSCQNQIKKGEPRHCGNLKDNWFDEKLLVSPFDPDCENRFSYSGNGAIHPTDSHDQAAIMTLIKLGLDISILRAMRAAAIEPFLEPSLSEEEFLTFFSDYLSRDSLGRFNAFWTTIRSVFK